MPPRRGRHNIKPYLIENYSPFSHFTFLKDRVLYDAISPKWPVPITMKFLRNFSEYSSGATNPVFNRGFNDSEMVLIGVMRYYLQVDNIFMPPSDWGGIRGVIRKDSDKNPEIWVMIRTDPIKRIQLYEEYEKVINNMTKKYMVNVKETLDLFMIKDLADIALGYVIE